MASQAVSASSLLFPLPGLSLAKGLSLSSFAPRSDCMPQLLAGKRPALPACSGKFIVYAKSKKHSEKKVESKRAGFRKVGVGADEKPSNGAAGKAVGQPLSGGQDHVANVPISGMKKVAQQSLQAVAVGCMTEMHLASKAQVDNSGDGRDEEVIHQMRVALRRLRSVVDAFADVLALPPAAQRKAITRILKTLGRLRDTDVMQETLDSVLERAGSLPDGEREAVEAVRGDIRAVREKAIAEVAALLQGGHTRDLMKANQSWLAQPRFRKGTAGLVAQRAGAVGPALAVQRIATVFKHPAWSIEEIGVVDASAAGGVSSEGEGAPAVSALDSVQCATMHDLRKKIRELRYLMELLAPVYSKSKEYKKALQQMVKMQSMLGDLQDLEVLSQFIGRRLPHLPHYSAAMAAAHQHTWLRWMEQKQALLTTSGRAGVYEAVLWPNGNDAASDLVADSDEEVLTEEEETTEGSANNNGVGVAMQTA